VSAVIDFTGVAVLSWCDRPPTGAIRAIDPIHVHRPTMPKTEPAKSWPVRRIPQRAEPPVDKGRKFEPFHIAAIGHGASRLARELRMDRKR
jgi:hypothetical protein